MNEHVPLTGDEADLKSQNRARTNQFRLAVGAVFMFVSFLILAAMLQQQQARMTLMIEANTDNGQRMCEQRRANALKTNANWEALAVIERRNKFIDEDIRSARLKVYVNAKLEVPECAK